MRKGEAESGTNSEPLSEAEIILQETEEQMKSAKTDFVSISAKESEQQKNERKKAMAVTEMQQCQHGQNLKVSLILMKKRVPVRNLKGGKEDLVVTLCSTLKSNVKLMQK